MRITRAERGFLLLAETRRRGRARTESVAGLQRARRPPPGRASIPLAEVQGLSSSVVRKALRDRGDGGHRATRWPTPRWATAQSVILMDLRTIVCIPLRSPRGGGRRGAAAAARWARSTSTTRRPRPPSAPTACRTAEALARHAALAIENAQLFEREQAHDRGAAAGPEAAPAVREAGHHRPDGGRHRPRAQHPAHLHHGQPRAARRPSRSPTAQKEMLTSDRPRAPSASRAWPRACSPSAGPPRRSRSPLAVNDVDRAQPGAVPLPDPQGRGAAPRRSSAAGLPAGAAACPTSSRWRSSTSS